MPRSAPEGGLCAGAEGARGAGGGMAKGPEHLQRAQVPRGGRAGPRPGGPGFNCGCCRAVAGEEGGGGAPGFRQKQGQERRVAPQRERERPPPSDGVEGPAGGTGHQNVRDPPSAVELQGLLVAFGLEKSTSLLLS